MDVLSTLDGQVFVWVGEKAQRNALRCGVRFEQAREALLDPLARYEMRVQRRRRGMRALG